LTARCHFDARFEVVDSVSCTHHFFFFVACATFHGKPWGNSFAKRDAASAFKVQLRHHTPDPSESMQLKLSAVRKLASASSQAQMTVAGPL